MTYHFIGIGGIGMSGLAHILLEREATVSGSDLSSSSIIRDLVKRGATCFTGHHPAHLPKDGTIVFSSGIGKKNPELVAAIERGHRAIHRSELLADLTKGYRSLAVTGTHGKTTVAALLSYVLFFAKKDPTFAIGGLIDLENYPALNGKQGKGEDFVLEADESDGSFLNYSPFGAIVTSIESEHLDYFQTEGRMRKAFAKFASQVKSQDHFFYYGDDLAVGKTLGGKGISYGFNEVNDLVITSFRQEGWVLRFSLVWKGKKYHDIELKAIGKHNVLNGAAAFGFLLQMGIDENTIRGAFASFCGVHRRAQIVGEVHDLLFIDDYAHHPTEIKTTLCALKIALYPRRLVVIHEPHRFTRLQSHLEGFSTSFEDADLIMIPDLYRAGEEPILGVDSHLLIRTIYKQTGKRAIYLPNKGRMELLWEHIRSDDAIITMGAGSITHLHAEMIPYFYKRGVAKLKVGLFFGGPSVEHEISCQTAACVESELDRHKYEPLLFKIEKSTGWTFSKKMIDQIMDCDILFPLFHGPMGEDGTVQGFFELLKKPYVGPNFRACSLCMDKVLAKKLCAIEGVLTLPFISLERERWRDKIKESRGLSFPLFVKPAHLGSSVGVRRVENEIELEIAVAEAFRFDTTLLIEEGLTSPRELEFAILGNRDHEPIIPFPGELKTFGAIYDYEKKYGENPIGVELYPFLTEEQKNNGFLLANKVYCALGCDGMARVDFFLDSKGDFWFNEINPIPGFTPNSMYPKIWEREGVSIQALLSRLIAFGLKRCGTVSSQMDQQIVKMASKKNRKSSGSHVTSSSV